MTVIVADAVQLASVQLPTSPHHILPGCAAAVGKESPFPLVGVGASLLGRGSGWFADSALLLSEKQIVLGMEAEESDLSSVLFGRWKCVARVHER